MSIGGHQSAVALKDEWLTPPEIIKALGPFDLDPCAPVNRPWDTADDHYTIYDDGLIKPWGGRVWCNPPYGRETPLWLARCVEHGNCIALIFARTETKMFFDHVWGKADALLFLEGRLHFHHVDGSRAKANSGAPSVLVAYGQNNVAALITSGYRGRLVHL
ncbi:MAG: DNA N-6-adenine-methyltransferase [Porticoccaceae bacterium]